MARYRSSLPQMAGGAFLAEASMETALIDLEGQQLPHHAAFVLLENRAGRTALTRYHERQLQRARRAGSGCVIDTATWRANPDWGRRLGYGLEHLAAINSAGAALAAALRDKWQAVIAPLVINGVIGSRSDGSSAGWMSVTRAEDYHAFQVEIFGQTQVDLISASRMHDSDEAIGIARAARGEAIPCAISFAIGTDGRLATGQTLQEAIEEVDDATDGYPLHFTVDCARSAHGEAALAVGGKWAGRIRGIRIDALASSHADRTRTGQLPQPNVLNRPHRHRPATRVVAHR